MGIYIPSHPGKRLLENIYIHESNRYMKSAPMHRGIYAMQTHGRIYMSNHGIIKGDIMSDYTNDYRYFENRDCKYYPCHKGTEHINCLFCYCPMYHLQNCPGNPSYIERGEKIIKDCTNCTFSHQKENYDRVMSYLRG